MHIISKKSATLDALLQEEDFREIPQPWKDASFDIIHAVENHENYFSISIPEVILSGNAFMEVLFSVCKPDEFSFFVGRRAILADWDILDNQNEQENARLVKIHRHLGNNWTEFVDHHRIPFTSALYESSERREFMDLVPLGIMTKSQIQESILKNPSYILTRAAYGHTHSKQLRKSKFRAMSLEEKRKIIENGLCANFASLADSYFRNTDRDSIVVDDFDAKPLFSKYSNGRRYDVIELHDEKRRVLKVEYAKTSLEFEVRGGVPVEINREVGIGKGLSPWIIWKEREGKREYPTINLPKNVQSLATPYANPLLGLIVSYLFSPKIKNELPSKLSLPGSRIQQRMGEAQIPVLALMYRQKLLNGCFFEKAEHYCHFR